MQEINDLSTPLSELTEMVNLIDQGVGLLAELTDLLAGELSELLQAIDSPNK